MSNQELQVIEQPELNEVVKSSKIELTKAQAHALKFQPLMQQYHELAAVLGTLNKDNPSTEDAKKAREARLKMVKIRTGSEAVKDELKSIILVEGDLIQGLHNVVKNTCQLTEAEFMDIEKHQERLENDRLEKLKQERINLLTPYVDEINPFVDLKQMSDEQFDKYLDTEKEAFTARAERKKKEDAELLEKQRKEEEERLKKEQEEKAEQERIKKENEALKEKEISRQKMNLKFASRATKFIIGLGYVDNSLGMTHNETNKFVGSGNYSLFEKEDDFKAWASQIKTETEQDIEAKKERDRLAEENRKKQEELDRLKAQEQKAKKEKEEKEAKEKAEADALANASDKVKVRAFYDRYVALMNDVPELTSDAGKSLHSRLIEGMELVKQLIITDSKKLL